MIKRFVKSKGNYNEKINTNFRAYVNCLIQIPSAMAKNESKLWVVVDRTKDIPALQVNVEWLGNYFSGRRRFSRKKR